MLQLSEQLTGNTCRKQAWEKMKGNFLTGFADDIVVF